MVHLFDISCILIRSLGNFSVKLHGSYQFFLYITLYIRTRSHGSGLQGHVRYQFEYFETGVALKFILILRNLTTTNHRKSSELH